MFSKCIEDIIPELGRLLDSMKDKGSPSQPTASIALARYEEICQSLSVEDLQRNVEAVAWRRGSFIVCARLVVTDFV